jgi:hypothetical protein
VDALPLALLRLRESEIVRLCGLARAARGQELLRQGKIVQAERSAGTLRATILEGETSRVVAAHFSDAGMDAWECSCSIFTERRAAAPNAQPPMDASPAEQPQEPASSPALPAFACEHVAALLSAWLHGPRRFQMEGGKPASQQTASPEVAPPAPPETALASLAPASGGVPPAPAALESLGSVPHRLLGLLALVGGRVTDEEAQRLFARMGLGPIEAAPQILSHLQEAGWLEPLQPGNRGRSRPLVVLESRGWMIPAELLAQVPREVALEAITVGAEGAELRIQRAEGQGLPGQLVLALALVLANSTSDDRARTLEEHLAVPVEQARFFLRLLYLAGLSPDEPFIPKGAKSSAAPPEQAEVNAGGAFGATLLRGARFLLWREADEVQGDLLTLWRHAHLTGELADLREAGVRVAISNHRERRKIGADIVAEHQAAKAFVLDLLGAVPVGRWWSFGSWVEFVWRFRPEFLRGRQQALLRPEWWLERVEDGEALSPEVRAEWRQAEGRYLALLFRRALHWLGLLDLAFDAQGRLKAFRVTPAGARLFQKPSPVETPPSAEQAVPQAVKPRKKEQPFPLQAMGDDRLLVPLAALREANPSMLENVLHWCEPAGATADGLLVQPTARRVAAALDAQRDLEAWLAALESTRPAHPAMSALVARVRGWAAAYGRVQISSPVALLEVADAALMRELERVVNLAERRDHVLSPELAVIRPAEVEALLEDLRRRGYAPWCKIP